MQIIGTVLACVIAYFALSGFDIATLAKAAFVGAVSVGATQPSLTSAKLWREPAPETFNQLETGQMKPKQLAIIFAVPFLIIFLFLTLVPTRSLIVTGLVGGLSGLIAVVVSNWMLRLK